MNEQSTNKYEDLLSVECAFYERERENLLLKYPNRVLLIQGEDVAGTFASEDEAVGEGIRKFGNRPFLVRRSGEDAPVLVATSLELGILRGSSTLN